MKDVVCDTSPLIFLAKIGMLELLDVYKIRIPSQVISEINAGTKKARPDALLITEYIVYRGISPQRINPLKDLPDSLGHGEKAVISLALRENVDDVLIDESKARTVARFKGLKPRGTIGVLWSAYKDGRLSRKKTEKMLIELVTKGYRIKEEILIELLQKLK